MVRAWFMDSSDEDQRKPHQCDPPQPVSLDELKSATGVLHWQVYTPKTIKFNLIALRISVHVRRRERKPICDCTNREREAASNLGTCDSRCRRSC